MKLKSVEDLKEAVERNGIRFMPVRNCSICEFQMGYTFHENGNISIDTGCSCVRYENVQYRTWEFLLDQVNTRIANKIALDELSKQWGFTE